MLLYVRAWVRVRCPVPQAHTQAQMIIHIHAHTKKCVFKTKMIKVCCQVMFYLCIRLCPTNNVKKVNGVI